MRSRTAPLLVLPLLLSLPLSAAEGPGVVIYDPHGEGYYAAVYTEDPQPPHEGDSYDCAGASGPSGPIESATWNVQNLQDGAFQWGPPHLNPRCVALDTGLPIGVPAVGAASEPRVECERTGKSYCKWMAHEKSSGEGGTRLMTPDARVTYNFTSGQYSVQLLSPFAFSIQGQSGVLMLFDCHHCPPPW